jgi:hypothetical protein
MKKIAFIFLILMMILTGCGVTSSKEGASQKVKKEEKIEAKQLPLEEYGKKVGQLHEKMKTAIDDFGEATRSEYDKGFDQRVLDGIEGVRDVLKEFRAIAPPEEQKKVGEEFTVAMDELNKAMDLFEKAVKTKKQKHEQAALDHLQKGNDYWNHAYRLLSVYVALPAGTDGAIDTDDLKNMDTLAGMDRDSVLLNVSEDGRELVGKWGFTNKDGTPNINIVLHKGGKYEGYSNGKYKDPNNAIIGTWEYDYLKSIVIFHNESITQNGEKLEEGKFRPVRKMELQKFKDGEMLLMDLEAHDSFRTDDLRKQQ